MTVPLEVVQLGADHERCRVRRVVESIRKEHDDTAVAGPCAVGYDQALNDVLRALETN